MLELVEVGILEEEDIEHATSATFNPVIRNEALLLLKYLMREAEVLLKRFLVFSRRKEVQKVVVLCRKFKKFLFSKVLLERLLVLSRRKEVQKVVLLCRTE
ncbi:hypothetical protein POM88_001748 [Heracleum sosnowskyi]|uniref:Uncharacterized protein n=1 Tax=Heracleum sosnowskyi TaxID=360622 RepID=A0AAD8JE53_9APIA|nr:hypothetical protein POM88_001748 [Heracleum sosnowskyi]